MTGSSRILVRWPDIVTFRLISVDAIACSFFLPGGSPIAGCEYRLILNQLTYPLDLKLQLRNFSAFAMALCVAGRRRIGIG
jgi:hypothetical protein